MQTSICRTAAAFFAAGVILAILRPTPHAEADEPAARSSSGKVTLLRVPNGGIQPQAMVDAKGVVHLIYLAGEPRACDVFYGHMGDGRTSLLFANRPRDRGHFTVDCRAGA